jgi:ribosomal protein S18 acetylase RimI-like enzyme
MMLIRLLLIFMAIVFDCAAYRVTRITAARGLKARLPNMDYSRSLRSVRTGAEGEEQTLVNKTKNKYLMKGVITAEVKALKTIDCTIGDLPEIMRLSYDQFKDSCQTDKDRAELRAEIQGLFLPKMVFNPFMGHRIIGLQKEDSRELVGFVDLSMQPQSLEALKPLPYLLRSVKYGNNLKPYLCNLLVAPEYRRKGLGRRLVNECITTSKEWGFNELFLHVKESTKAPLNLYKSMGFKSCPPRESYASLLRKEFN